MIRCSYAFYAQTPPEFVQAAPEIHSPSFNPKHHFENVYFSASPEIAEGEKVLSVGRVGRTGISPDAVFVVSNWEDKPLWQGVAVTKLSN